MPKDAIQPDAEQEIRSAGKALGELLVRSSLPDDVKASWVALLPQLKWQQVLRLIELLESERAASGEGMDELKQQLMTIKEKYERQRAETASQAQAELDALTVELQKEL